MKKNMKNNYTRKAHKKFAIIMLVLVFIYLFIAFVDFLVNGRAHLTLGSLLAVVLIGISAGLTIFIYKQSR